MLERPCYDVRAHEEQRRVANTRDPEEAPSDGKLAGPSGYGVEFRPMPPETVSRCS